MNNKSFNQTNPGEFSTRGDKQKEILLNYLSIISADFDKNFIIFKLKGC